METFVVRVWTSVDATSASAQPAELLGLAEHIGSKRESSFRDADELLALIRAALEAAVGAGRRSSNDGQPPESPPERGTYCWGNNDYGEPGSGTNTSASYFPVAVARPAGCRACSLKFVSISAALVLPAR